MSLRASPIVFLLCALCSCASLPALLLPTITDDRLEAFVAEEAKLILRVSGNAHKAALYRFYLVDFPRPDILGLSFGGQRIYISYELTRLARQNTGYLWLFRHTLAHEIAHDALEHAKSEGVASLNSVRQTHGRITGRDLGLPLFISFRNYSPAAELAADQTAMEYWKKIGWDWAGGGAIIGAIAENAGMGAAIGAGVGATSGFLYGKHQEGEQEAYQRGVADGKQSQSR